MTRHENVNNLMAFDLGKDRELNEFERGQIIGLQSYNPYSKSFKKTLTQLNIYGVNLNEGAGNALYSQQIFMNLKKYYKKNGEKFHLKLILNLLKACHIELKHALGIKDGLQNIKCYVCVKNLNK